MLEFVFEIQDIPNNDHSKSIRSVPRDIRVSEFLIWHEMHDDFRYFSNKIKKDYFLSQAMKVKRKYHAAKPFNKRKHPLQPNRLWFFLDAKDFCYD